MHYLKTWFVLDALTCAPIDLILTLAQGDNGSGGGMEAVARVMRALRVVKLARILRSSRILKRWQDHIGMSNAWLQLLQNFVITVIMTHWNACLWGYVGGVASHVASDHSYYTRSLGVPGGISLEQVCVR
jgi:hypothetical protein